MKCLALSAFRAQRLQILEGRVSLWVLFASLLEVRVLGGTYPRARARTHTRTHTPPGLC